MAVSRETDARPAGRASADFFEGRAGWPRILAGAYLRVRRCGPGQVVLRTGAGEGRRLLRGGFLMPAQSLQHVLGRRVGSLTVALSLWSGLNRPSAQPR